MRHVGKHHIVTESGDAIYGKETYNSSTIKCPNIETNRGLCLCVLTRTLSKLDILPCRHYFLLSDRGESHA